MIPFSSYLALLFLTYIAFIFSWHYGFFSIQLGLLTFYYFYTSFSALSRLDDYETPLNRIEKWKTFLGEMSIVSFAILPLIVMCIITYRNGI